VFIGAPLTRPNDSRTTMSDTHSMLTQDYATSTIMLENQELKRKIAFLTNEKYDLKMQLQQYQMM
jgi:hypothetical protein